MGVRVLTSFHFQKVLSTVICLLYVGFLMRVVELGGSSAIASSWEFGEDLGIFCLFLIFCGAISTVSVYFLP